MAVYEKQKMKYGLFLRCAGIDELGSEKCFYIDLFGWEESQKTFIGRVDWNSIRNHLLTVPTYFITCDLLSYNFQTY